MPLNSLPLSGGDGALRPREGPYSARLAGDHNGFRIAAGAAEQCPSPLPLPLSGGGPLNYRIDSYSMTNAPLWHHTSIRSWTQNRARGLTGDAVPCVSTNGAMMNWNS